MDGGDAATVEIAVENTLVIGLQLFQVVFLMMWFFNILVSRT